MLTKQDVFFSFKRAESVIKKKKVNFPKNWEVYKSKLSKEKLEKLQNVTDKFNTIWCNISVENYFIVGFEKLKSFNLLKMDDKKIITYYIIKDKKVKRDFREIKKNNINDSINYIYSENISLKEYCNKGSEFMSNPVQDYIKNKIDPVTLMFLIEDNYLTIKDNEWMILPYVRDNYTEIKQKMYGYNEFIKKRIVEMSEKLDKTNYLEKKKGYDKNKQTEELLYNGETIQEKREKKKKYQENNLNEDV